MYNTERRKMCPNCNNTIDMTLKLELLKSPEIQCPYCLKALRIGETKAFLVTLPLNSIFSIALVLYTDASSVTIFIYTYFHISYLLPCSIPRNTFDSIKIGWGIKQGSLGPLTWRWRNSAPIGRELRSSSAGNSTAGRLYFLDYQKVLKSFT